MWCREKCPASGAFGIRLPCLGVGVSTQHLGFWQGCSVGAIGLQEVMGQVLGCGTAALMEQLGVAGMHQLALECLGCSWSPGIQLLFYAQPLVRCANLSSQH